MTTNIQLLRSSIANKRPAPATLLDGQAAVNLNTTEPGLYFKLSSGVLTKVGPTCVNSSGSAPNSTPAGSSGNAVGEQWLDARSSLTSPVLKVYDGSVWRPSSGFTVSDSTGAFSLNNQLTVRNLISNGTGANSYVQLNAGPTTDQSSITAATGMVRYDSTTNEYMGYYGGSSAGWRIIGPSITTPGNGQINVNAGTGITITGSNATANQTGNTTRTVTLDTTYADGRYVLTTGSTMTGFLTLNANPTSNLQAATKQYVDNNSGGAPVTVSSSPPASPAEGDLWWDEDEGKLFVYYTDANSSQWVEASPSNAGSNYVAIGGDTMTGLLTLSGDPTANLGAATKQYVDSKAVVGLDAWGQIAANGTITGSYNVASATNSGTGVYAIVFTTAMPNANYAVTSSPAGNFDFLTYCFNFTTTGFTVNTKGSSSPLTNCPFSFQVSAST